MGIPHNSTTHNIVKMLMAISVIAMLIIGIAVYGASPISLLIFAVYICFYVQLPGILILNAARIRLNHFSTYLVTGFMTGWCLILAEYFLCDLLNNDIILYSLGPVCSVLLIVLKLCQKRKTCIRLQAFQCDCFHFSPSKLPTTFCITFVLILLYGLLNTQYIYQAPENSAYILDIHSDMAYHMGLINSLSHDYPLVSLWVADRVVKYHIFSEILYAIPVRLFGLTADFLIMSCGPYLTTYLVSVSMYSLYREFLSKRKYVGVYCLITIAANMYITKSLFSSWYMYHVFSNVNNFGFGISACMVTVLCGKYYIEALNSASPNSPGEPKKLLILLTAFVMLVTGIKGPIGIVLVGGMWGTLILGLILRKLKLKSVLPVLIVSAAFLLIYIIILGMKGQSNGSGSSFLAFATVADIAFFKKPLVLFLKSLGLPKIIRLAVVFAVFMVLLLTVFLIPYIVCFIRELVLVLSGRKPFDFVKITVFAASLVGLIGMFILNYSGHSQVYFGFVTIAFAPLISFWLFEDLSECDSIWVKLLKGLTALFIVMSSAILIGTYMISIDKAVDRVDTSDDNSTYTSISNQEYEAMVWLRENTPDDSLLATDRYYSVSPEDYSYENRWDNRFFAYGNYSNRFCYISGSGYNMGSSEWPLRQEMIEKNNKLYDVKFKGRDKLAHKLGIDYVVVSKRFTDVDNLSDSVYKLCYSNDDVDIYEIQ